MGMNAIQNKQIQNLMNQNQQSSLDVNVDGARQSPA